MISEGSRLGPYEILSPLGAGGMGEVYRARDTRLAREVAIKVLPESLASDVERLRRFEKEAKSASALNHQNIVTIYDIGSESGMSFIAMELVDGVTLRELLASGPLSTKKLLQISPQIAEGLARAHEAGIVHRDLKPENVMVKKDGLVKILDFGLAKLTSTGSGSDEASQLPTMTGTQPGVVVGTVSYMSPEQASGQTVDFRSDQFSLGSMLYEMATGKRAFQKKTAIDTLSAILNDDPEPLVAVNPQAPAPLRWITERCLAKEPRARYASTEDLARDLASLRDHLTEVSSGWTASMSASAARRQRLTKPLVRAIAATLVLGAGILAGWWIRSRQVREDAPSTHRLTFRRGNVLTARFAPDGRTVVFGAAWDRSPAEIFTVRTDSVESRPLGLARADVMAISSKGELAILLKKVGLLLPEQPGTLARVPLGGGTPREILEDVFRADWAPDGNEMAVLRRAANGSLQIEYPVGNVIVRSPNLGANLRISPNGELVACNENDTILTLDRKGNRTVVSSGWSINELVWSPKGDEIFFNGTRLGTEGLSIRAVSLTGRVRVILSNALNFTLHDVASDGRLLLEHAVGRGNIVYRSSAGSREGEYGWLDALAVRGVSTDGRFVLFVDSSEPPGMFLLRTDGSPPIRLGDGDAQSLSIDGSWALTLVGRPSKGLVMVPTGPGVARSIPVEGMRPEVAWLLPNGLGFLVGQADKPGLYAVGPNGGKPGPVRADGFALDGGVVVSPNGTRFACLTQDRHVELVRISDGDVAVVLGGALEPDSRLVQWSSDDRFLYVSTGLVPVHVDRLEIATGRRELWRDFVPDDPIGVVGAGNVVVARDGEGYAYNYFRVVASDLYVMNGVR